MRHPATLPLAAAVLVYVACFLFFRWRQDKVYSEPAPGEPAPDEQLVDKAHLLEPSEKEAVAANVEQVKLLFEYTKFHITAYITIASLIVGVISTASAQRFSIALHYLPAAVLAVLAAGWAAGVVAASMPECTRRANFWNWLVGPYRYKLMTIRGWTFLEHTSFWLAVGLLLVAFFTGGSVPSGSEVTMTIKN